MRKTDDEFNEIVRKIRSLAPRQREVFDAVCINQDRQCDPKVLEKLRTKGLIELAGVEKIPFIGSLMMEVKRYRAPLQIHYAWAVVGSEDFAKEAAAKGMTVEEYERFLDEEMKKES